MMFLLKIISGSLILFIVSLIIYTYIHETTHLIQFEKEGLESDGKIRFCEYVEGVPWFDGKTYTPCVMGLADTTENRIFESKRDQYEVEANNNGLITTFLFQIFSVFFMVRWARLTKK